MSNVAKIENSGSQNTKPCRPGELHVSGKLNAIDKFQLKNKEVRYRNRVLMKDELDDFSYPMPVDIVTREPLGKVGEIWSGIVMIRTFREDYNTKPDEDGVVRKIKKVKLDCYYEVD